MNPCNNLTPTLSEGEGDKPRHFVPVRTLTQHYLRKKINKTKQNHLERILEAFRRHLEGMRGHALVNKNYFLRLYVYTSYADSKRSVSDRWLTNDKEAQSALNIYILPFFHISIFLGAAQLEE